MPFGIVSRTGPVMRQIVGFGDRSTGRGTFGGEFGAHHCKQLGLYGVCVWQRPLPKLVWVNLSSSSHLPFLPLLPFVLWLSKFIILSCYFPVILASTKVHRERRWEANKRQMSRQWFTWFQNSTALKSPKWYSSWLTLGLIIALMTLILFAEMDTLQLERRSDLNRVTVTLRSPVVFVEDNSSWFRVDVTEQYPMFCPISWQFTHVAASLCRISVVQFLTSSV